MTTTNFPLALDDVVYWSRDKLALYRVTKLNRSKPRIVSNAEYATNVPYENLTKQGNINDVFGRCRKCQKPGKTGERCRKGRFRCDGIIDGRLNYLLQALETPNIVPPNHDEEIRGINGIGYEELIDHLSDQFADSLRLCGRTRVNHEIIARINSRLSNNNAEM